MADLIPTDPQQLNPASPSSPPQVAADALGSTKQATASTSPLVGDVGMDETVSGQLKKLISEDSPVLQQARARSQREAAARGLQNSSVAAQAGEEALYAAATPIASQDASTVNARRNQNLSTVNQFGINLQQTEQQKQLIQTQTDASSRLQAEQGNISADLQEKQGAINERLQKLSADQEITRLREQGTINERLQTLDQNFKSLQADLDRGAALTLEDKRFQSNQALVISEYAQRAGLSKQEADQEIARLNAGHLNTLDEIAAQAKASAELSKADLGPKLQAQYLDAVNQRMAAASAEIQNIYTTQGLKPAQQEAAVAKARAQMQSDLTQLQAYYTQSPLWDTNWGNSQVAQPGTTDTGGGYGGYDFPPQDNNGFFGNLIQGM